MKNYKVIGLMSGTSIDGLDIAYCEFEKKDGKWTYALPAVRTITYPEYLTEQLKHATQLNAEQLALLDIKLGRFFGEKVNAFISSEKISPTLVCSHGHTVFHQPEAGLTLQIGNGFEVHKACHLPVINNFRQLDVSLGGHGAPLVPVGDQLLFSEFDFCLNLGGIANVSGDVEGERKAFDICAVNMVLNHLSLKEGKPYDEGGAMARQGNLLPKLLEALNSLPFYEAQPPKSLGYEWVLENVLNYIDQYGGNTDDLLHTYVLHAAAQIGNAIQLITSSEKGERKLIVTGGGAYNDFLIENIKDRLAGDVQLIVPSEKTINFKEALIFGFLGVLKQRGEINTLKSVTGAMADSSGGILHHGFHDLN